jgi:hypothetical protein
MYEVILYNMKEESKILVLLDFSSWILVLG